MLTGAVIHTSAQCRTHAGPINRGPYWEWTASGREASNRGREREREGGRGTFWGNARVLQELMEATKQPLGLEVKIQISSTEGLDTISTKTRRIGLTRAVNCENIQQSRT